MYKTFISLFIAFSLTVPSFAQDDCCHLDEHLVVDFPISERDQWQLTDNIHTPEGVFFEKWSFEGDDQMTLLLTTLPWECVADLIEEEMEDIEGEEEDDGELPTAKEVAEEILSEENEMPWTVIEAGDEEAIISYEWENEEIVMLRFIITPFALHTINFLYQGEDVGFADRKKILALVKECCYLVY